MLELYFLYIVLLRYGAGKKSSSELTMADVKLNSASVMPFEFVP